MSPLPQNWREIANRINTEVNALPYKADATDKWDAAGEDVPEGDCDDFALGKLRRLLRLGFPIERLRLATCRIGWRDSRLQEPHAVLVLDAPDDHYALDNLFQEIVPIYHLIGAGYSLEKIQKVGGSREWVRWVHQ